MKRAVNAHPGEALWVVYEHFYYPEAGALVQKEYCVVRAEVVEVNEYGWMTLGGCGYWDKLGTGSLGTLVFRSAQEAARRAQALTDREDRVWGGEEDGEFCALCDSDYCNFEWRGWQPDGACD